MKAPWNFARYLPIAQRFLKRGRLPALLLAVTRKSGGGARSLSSLRGDLVLLQELCVAWWRGSYRAVNPQALVAIVAGLIYFVSPLDALPDFIPGLGLVDDLAVLAWVMKTWGGELDAFRTWRDAQDRETREAIAKLPVAERVT
ncbi:YkvA family protein [Pseudomonas argentinensis]|uniref:YkvA family protein n=1 Tax=Phytopseudomonas argentinensis TaxID=289370 RepID=UPI0008AA5804|nr:YkvA family protein [Pseudomonas argentinensis]